MRVLLHADVDLSLPGGVETHVKQLAKHLEQRGHEVHVFGRPRSLDGLHMVGAVEATAYDVLHHHGGMWPSRLGEQPHYVKTLHFCVAAKMEAYVRLGRLRTLLNPGNWNAVAEERAAVHRSGHFVPVSSRVMDQFVRWHGLDPDHATMIPNGVDPDAVHADPNELRSRFDLSAETRVMLTIGRDDFVKGYGLLGRAWRRVRATLDPNSVWVTVGGAASHRSDDRIVTGPVTHAEALGWIRAADVGALPSYYEGNSVALLEMLQGGLYVLAHDVGAARDVIRTPDAGRLVDAAEQPWIEALTIALGGDPVSTRTPQLSGSYHWGSIAAQMEQVYARVRRP